jgi:hypothetical protein
MARVPPGDLTLINDSGSPGESRSAEAANFSTGRRAFPRKFSDAFDALEFGLPLSAAASDEEPALPAEQPAAGRVRAAAPSAPRAADVHVPLMAAALIICGCMAIGGAAAVLVFHDRVMHITAVWMASHQAIRETSD